MGGPPGSRCPQPSFRRVDRLTPLPLPKPVFARLHPRYRTPVVANVVNLAVIKAYVIDGHRRS
jgi:amino acid transporter